jgi:hypothetical protein
MKRQTYRAAILDNGQTIAESAKSAMNSAIRETEALLRNRARVEGTTYSGGVPMRVGDHYWRIWTNDATGAEVMASAQKVA